LRTCGVTPRNTSSPEYVVHWILAFYVQWQRWPRGRDFTRPCGYSVVSNVFRDCNNSVAAAVQLAQDTLETLTVESIVLTAYLANHFTTVTPQSLRSTSTIIAPGTSTGRSTGGSRGTERTDKAPRVRTLTGAASTGPQTPVERAVLHAREATPRQGYSA
jgi:hypothetical protein